ncbi:hypothetical protein ACQ858_22775 [Variovorax ureilyticus]|uniref:hypothetical protein n=1 Tax=Variovorax ureilyticus TaxID=1836198 RepID=UPI003D671C69
MAKSSRSPAQSLRKVASSALQITDEFCHLKEVHRAYACLEGLLSPVHRAMHYEEFSFEPGDLRALVTVINLELQRRTEPVDEAIRSLEKALRAKAK